mmetsp:Transcript_7579/g.25787  ORF Transcript_7579/g.25787 Transcript_7579/m.25787 type:complete len:323 (+) Transcript_7579:2231-3199(+)
MPSLHVLHLLLHRCGCLARLLRHPLQLRLFLGEQLLQLHSRLLRHQHLVLQLLSLRLHLGSELRPLLVPPLLLRLQLLLRLCRRPRCRLHLKDSSLPVLLVALDDTLKLCHLLLKAADLDDRCFILVPLRVRVLARILLSVLISEVRLFLGQFLARRVRSVSVLLHRQRPRCRHHVRLHLGYRALIGLPLAKEDSRLLFRLLCCFLRLRCFGRLRYNLLRQPSDLNLEGRDVRCRCDALRHPLLLRQEVHVPLQALQLRICSLQVLSADFQRLLVRPAGVMRRLRLHARLCDRCVLGLHRALSDRQLSLQLRHLRLRSAQLP